MKTNYLIIIMLCITLYSCKKDDNNNSESVAPVADFSYNLGNGVAPCTVTFTNSTKNANSYSWDFGNGETSTSKNPTCTYSASGSFIVKLTATGDGGSNSVSKTVVINGSSTLYYISYMVDGVLITADSIKAIRDTISNPTTLTITGTGTPSDNNLPSINIYLKESFIGWVPGINVYFDNSSTSYVITFSDINNTVYSSSYVSPSEQMSMFFSKLSYEKGALMEATFRGTIKTSGGSSTKLITDGKIKLLMSN